MSVLGETGVDLFPPSLQAASDIRGLDPQWGALRTDVHVRCLRPGQPDSFLRVVAVPADEHHRLLQIQACLKERAQSFRRVLLDLRQGQDHRFTDVGDLPLRHAADVDEAMLLVPGDVGVLACRHAMDFVIGFLFSRPAEVDIVDGATAEAVPNLVTRLAACFTTGSLAFEFDCAEAGITPR